jgi:carbonic anhydrase
MSRYACGLSLLAALICLMPISSHAAVTACQAAAPSAAQQQHQDKPNMGQQHKDMPNMGQHHMDVPDTGDQKCDPKFTYEDGPHGPSHWEGVCGTGAMQAPIDIRGASKLSLAPMVFGYQPTEWAIANDCNKYEIRVKFPSNFWLRIGKKPYFLSSMHFHEPGETAINGKRPRMSIHLVHLSPESNFLVIEVQVIAGKENPLIKTLWEHIPEKGKEHKVPDIKINVTDLLPADRSYYRFPGSLTTPLCNEGVTWFVMKNPIEMSEQQIAEYMKYYHNNARPLQPLNNRPVAEPK